MTNYIIVQEVTAAALVALVNHEMTGGRIPLGSPFVWHDPSDGKTVLCQAMIYPAK